MSDGGILIFSYDGTFDGMMSAVFDSFLLKVTPSEVYIFGEEQPSLYKIHTVFTDKEHSRRVQDSIMTRLGERSISLIQRCFLYGEKGKEIAIIRYIKKGFNGGRKVIGMIADPEINPLYKMVMAVNNEANQYFGFVRFQDSNGALVSVIHPKHLILPVIKGYFLARMYNETFMIYDESHHSALIHQGNNTAIMAIEDLQRPDPSEDAFYCDLWKLYYEHIAIDSRYNPKCRMNHMPKRFWTDLPEVSEELSDNYRKKLSLGTRDEIREKLLSEKQNALTEEKKNERSLP